MAGLGDSMLPYQAPTMDNPFVTPGDQQRQRLSTAFGWDVGQPGQEFLRRLPLLLQMMPRSPAGARIGDLSVWAARPQRPDSPYLATGNITGGYPQGWGTAMNYRNYAPTAESSAGLVGRNPGAFQTPSLHDNMMIFPETLGGGTGYPYRPHSGLPWPQSVGSPANANVPPRLR